MYRVASDRLYEVRAHGGWSRSARPARAAGACWHSAQAWLAPLQVLPLSGRLCLPARLLACPAAWQAYYSLADPEAQVTSYGERCFVCTSSGPQLEQRPPCVRCCAAGACHGSRTRRLASPRSAARAELGAGWQCAPSAHTSHPGMHPPAVLDAVSKAVAGLEVEALFRERAGLIESVRGGLGGVLHAHGFDVSDCLITVSGPVGGACGGLAWLLLGWWLAGRVHCIACTLAGAGGWMPQAAGWRRASTQPHAPPLAHPLPSRPPLRTVWRLQVMSPASSVKVAMSGVLAARRNREAAFEQVGRRRGWGRAMGAAQDGGWPPACLHLHLASATLR